MELVTCEYNTGGKWLHVRFVMFCSVSNCWFV